MRRSLLVATCLLGLAGTIGVTDTNAAGLPRLDGIAVGSAVQTVQGYGYCRRLRNDCAHRWGWGTWRFNRCVNSRGC